MKKFIISGGGTGGHIYPAIAIANALKEIHPDAEILFVGAKGRMEMQKVPEAGYPIEGLWISGIQRKLTLDNLSFPLKLISSLRKSSKIIREFKPDAVIGVGGYASGPLLYMATQMNVPTLIQEQNSYAGLTNKLLASKVNTICVAHEHMERFFPKDKLVFTGNPVRKDIVTGNEIRKEEALDFFELSHNKKTILVIGGSLGARTLNDSILEGLSQLIEEDVQLIWQIGKFYYKNVRERLKAYDETNIRPMEFIKEMNKAYSAADIVISRSGALSVSELCLVQKPVIFVPSPNVAEDHQTKNAKALTDHQAAWMVRDQEAVENLVPTALKLLKDETTQQKLKKNIATLGRPNAAEDIAQEVLKLVD